MPHPEPNTEPADAPGILAHRRYIEDALTYSSGTHDFEDIVAGVEAGTLQYWPGLSSAIITEIIDTPKKRLLHFFLAGGNLAELEVMWPLIREWGKSQGCTSASLVGRRGWERTFLAKHGWTTNLAVFEGPV